MNVKAKPQIVSLPSDASRVTREARSRGQRVGVVMTMGGLHAGHLHLIETCTQENDFTVVTIFVNPTQFGPREDFDKYPRHLDQDLAAIAELPVDVVFAPVRREMYSKRHSTYIQPPEVAQPLEGQFRPGHFQGVTTVVLKLLHIIPAHVAYFGHKDYQQFRVIQQMVADLNISVDIRVCSTIRDEDGLALSSRNQYLSQSEREQALAIPGALDLAEQIVVEGESGADLLVARMKQHLLEAGIERVDYAAVVDLETLSPIKTVEPAALAAIAAYIGNTRLIDNRPIGPAP